VGLGFEIQTLALELGSRIQTADQGWCTPSVSESPSHCYFGSAGGKGCDDMGEGQAETPEGLGAGLSATWPCKIPYFFLYSSEVRSLYALGLQWDHKWSKWQLMGTLVPLANHRANLRAVMPGTYMVNTNVKE